MKPAVLVVDDDRVSRELIANLLKHTYQDQIALFKARDGSTARQFFQKHEIDILITDVFMPDTNGFQLVDEFSSQSDGMITVVFSGNSDVLNSGHELNKHTQTRPTHLVAKHELVDNVLWIMEQSMEKFPLDED